MMLVQEKYKDNIIPSDKYTFSIREGGGKVDSKYIRNDRNPLNSEENTAKNNEIIDIYEPISKSNTENTKTSYRNSNNEIEKNDLEELSNNLKVKEDSKDNTGISIGEQRLISSLNRIDQAVRTHEMAHKSAGGGLVKGAATYSYTTGPDGKKYAVSGEVKIDISYNLNNPEQTISKMQRVRRAALAPAEPSPQDRSVATMASSIESKARAEIQKQGLENSTNSNNNINFNLNNIYNNSSGIPDQHIGKNLNIAL